MGTSTGPWGGGEGKRMATLGPLSQHAHALDLLRTLLASSVAASASVSPFLLPIPARKVGTTKVARAGPEVTFFSSPEPQ